MVGWNAAASRTRRAALAQIGAASGAVALAACGGGQAGDAPAPGAAAVGTRDATLSWQVQLPADKMAQTDTFLAEWRQKYPRIKVVATDGGSNDSATIEKTLTLAAGGTPFDVISKITFIQPIAAPGAVQPIDDLIKRDKFEVSKYNPNWLKTFGTYDGKLFSLPYRMGGSAMVFVYNRAHFAGAGIKEPSPDWTKSWTYDEYRQVAQKLTKRQGDTIDRAGTDQFGNQYFSTPLPFGGQWMKDQKTAACDSPEMNEAYTRWLDLMLKDRTTALSPGAEGLGNDRFYNGKVSIFYVVGSQVPNFTDPAKYKVDWAMVPQPKGSLSASPDLDTIQVGIGSKPFREESWTFVRWLLEKSRYAWFTDGMPPTVEDATAWVKETFKRAPANARVEVLIEGMKVARANDPMRAHPRAADISKEVHTPFWNDVRAQKVSVKDALADAKRKIQAIIGG
jgi:hypothetical protein